MSADSSEAPPVKEEPSAIEQVLEKMKALEAKLAESDVKLAEQAKQIEKQRIDNAVLSIDESKRDFVKKAIEGEGVEFAEKFVAKLKGMPDQAAGVIPNKASGEPEKFVPDDAWKLKRAKELKYVI